MAGPDQSARLIMEQAAALCQETAEEEQRERGLLPPCRNIDPLWPPLTLEEYDMMERDSGKYLLYYAAIERAVKDVARARVGQEVNILVPGPGLGRLVEFCVDAAQTHCKRYCVHAFDANPIAVDCSKERFKEDIGFGQVSIHGPFALCPGDDVTKLPSSLQPLQGQCDVIVSELVGSLADNEFMTELSSTALALFGRPTGCVLLPDTFVVYAAPFKCPTIAKYFHLLDKAHRMTESDRPSPYDSTFLCSPSKTMELLSPLKEIYRGRCDTAIPSVITRTEFTCSGPDYPDGIIGYFTCHLYGGVEIDSRHGSPWRNSYHWEAYVFPLMPQPIKTGQATNTPQNRDLTLCIERHFQSLPSSSLTDQQDAACRLWYSWGLAESGDTQPIRVSNKDGKNHSVYLLRRGYVAGSMSDEE